MYASATLSTLLPLLSFSLALPLEARDAPALTITDLRATFPYPYGPYGDNSVNSFVNIVLSYPDTSSTAGTTLSTTCSVNWPAGTNPGPTAWTACADLALQFRLPADGWTSTTNFRVELWQTLTSEGAGLDASHILTSNPGNPSDPNALMFCLQMGKFNPLTCTLTGPLGQSQRTVAMSTVQESIIPN
ncbi:hypothetical protein F5Y19DRAFT_458329 [Xylariaceae sp. FL1651]|nr:hypothetical protein F5Y19DRAFT_458329 [Xylariaceae sp. FL1651]